MLMLALRHVGACLVCLVKGHDWEWVSWSFAVEFICKRCGATRGYFG